MNLQQLKNIVSANNGATLTSDLDTATIDNGYMVSLQGYEIKTSIDLLSSDLLKDYQQLAKQHNAYVGLWVDNDNLYLDISVNIKDEKQAFKLARDNNQLAIYHIDKGATIYV